MDKAQLLRDASIFPSHAVLAEALGAAYAVYMDFMNRLQGINIETEWRYYNDGKAWLGKNTHKKKTVFWLSVWDGFFKVSMFFTEKTSAGIAELLVDKEYKTFEPLWAKLKPLVISVKAGTGLDDLFKVIEYKKNLK
jgi:hypothetical protein